MISSRVFLPFSLLSLWHACYASVVVPAAVWISEALFIFHSLLSVLLHWLLSTALSSSSDPYLVFLSLLCVPLVNFSFVIIFTTLEFLKLW